MIRDHTIDLRQASAYTGLSVTKLRALVASRGIPHEVRLDGAIRFQQSKLDAWLDGRKVQSGARMLDDHEEAP